jgi:nucleoside-diphosphate-sugar epimerase
MTVLITGLGYIGARLAEDLLAEGESVVALENFFSTPRSSLVGLTQRANLTLLQGSINRLETLRSAFARGPFRALVHLAAQPSAHPRAASARYTELTNLVGARLTLEAAIEAGVEVVVLGSSFRVYGDRLPAVVSESQAYGQVGDLAHLSKIYAEKLAEMLATSHSLRAVAVRLGVTYGVSPVMKTDPRFMTVPNRFAQLAAQGKPLTVHPTAAAPVGFIHVEDASSALMAALSAEWPERYRAVNAVSECVSVADLARLVQAEAQSRGIDCSVIGPAQADTMKISVETSLPPSLFQPRRQLSETAGELLDYFLRTTGPSASSGQAPSASSGQAPSASSERVSSGTSRRANSASRGAGPAGGWFIIA